MIEPSDAPPADPQEDWDSRVASLHEYLATHEPPSREGDDFTGGTIVHLPRVGRRLGASRNLPACRTPPALVAAGALLCAGLLIYLRRQARGGKTPS